MTFDHPEQPGLDIGANRLAKNYTLKIQIARVFWSFSLLLFRCSPRILWSWRNALLRMFGAQIGRQVHIHPSVNVEMPWNLKIGDFAAVGADVKIYNLGPLTIGETATISQGSHLCGGSHDYTQTTMPLLKCPINIGKGAWVCADAFVGPGVSIGEFAILGARSVAVSDVAAHQIAVGNPARVVKTRDITTVPIESLRP